MTKVKRLKETRFQGCPVQSNPFNRVTGSVSVWSGTVGRLPGVGDFRAIYCSDNVSRERKENPLYTSSCTILTGHDELKKKKKN